MITPPPYGERGGYALFLLREHPGCSLAELEAIALKHRFVGLSAGLRELESAGLARQESGRWVLTSTGASQP